MWRWTFKLRMLLLIPYIGNDIYRMFQIRFLSDFFIIFPFGDRVKTIASSSGMASIYVIYVFLIYVIYLFIQILFLSRMNDNLNCIFFIFV